MTMQSILLCFLFLFLGVKLQAIENATFTKVFHKFMDEVPTQIKKYVQENAMKEVEDFFTTSYVDRDSLSEHNNQYLKLLKTITKERAYLKKTALNTKSSNIKN